MRNPLKRGSVAGFTGGVRADPRFPGQDPGQLPDLRKVATGLQAGQPFASTVRELGTASEILLERHGRPGWKGNLKTAIFLNR